MDVALGLCLFGLIGCTPDYCLPELCPGSTHVACNKTEDLSSDCPDGAKLVDMDLSLQLAILTSHNQKRNDLASGSLPNLPSATRMATMIWNAELAKLAELNVKSCLYEHDACHNTVFFKYSGQNMGKQWWSGINVDDRSVILSLIDSWWGEYEFTTASDIDMFSAITPNTIGHFTAMARETNIAVGCAAIKFSEDSWDSLTLACNYATTNVIGLPVYEAGPIGANCTSGMDPLFTALCTTSELYDLDMIFS